MIDYFALALTHGLLLLAVLRLLVRGDLDREDGDADKGARQRRKGRRDA